MRVILGLFLSLWAAAVAAQGINNPGVVGPGSSTTADVVLFSGTSGKIIQDGSTTVVGNIAGLNLTGTTVPVNGVYLPAANTIGFATNSTAVGSMGASANFTMGSAAPVLMGAGGTLAVRVQGVSASSSVLEGGFVKFTDDANGTFVHLGKSRGATVGTNTIVAASDILGIVNFVGANGTGFTSGATISAVVDGTPGATTDMPGRLVFSTTPDGSGSAVEQMRISQAGLISVPNIASDATHVTATVCIDTTSKALYQGSAALGVCLGTSSARFKNINGPVRDGLKAVLGWETIDYRYKPDSGMDPNHDLYGFTAEQVFTVTPKLVGLTAAGLPNTVDMVGMIPVLVNAIQEQQAEIVALKAIGRP